MVSLYIQSKKFLIKEQYKTVRNYYYKPRFVLYDLAQAITCFFINPYRCCRRFLQKKGVQNIDGYGETPLSTFEKLVTSANLSSKDYYVELGSGRGKTCVWASQFIGCQSRGIEWVPHFAKFSKFLSRLFGIPVQFCQESMFETDLTAATVVYIYSTHLSEEELLKIPLAAMAVGSKLITISQPHPDFRVIQVIPVIFPWGDTIAYIQEK